MILLKIYSDETATYRLLLRIVEYTLVAHKVIIMSFSYQSDVIIFDIVR